MHKEAALNRYKIMVSYYEHSFNEIMEVYAVSLSEAESIAEEMKIKNHDLVERAGRLNVFVSKRIKCVIILPDHV